MPPNAATTAAILKALSRHLRGEEHERAEITINEARHEILASELDLLVRDPESPLVAARLILTLRDITPSPKPPTELAAHIFTTTTSAAGADPSSTSVILDDTHGGASQSQSQPQPQTPPPPHRTSTIPTHPHPHPSLKQTYKTYLKTFMSPPTTALPALPAFLHQPTVTHNRRPLGIPAYHGLGQAVRAAVPDVDVEVEGLLADGARGLVAARLRFRGTLAAAAAPAGGGGGGRVDIGEIVFYWFEGGRIREVVSLVDFGGVSVVGGGGGGGS
ncbi:hypothetical protein KVR01_012795 [Diaporthe batatas]|uniref:uncharacterized protein n=1 Tax=Diaporthe batatas TaxID=748121 RepID=UPI001D04A526|nr:uncharacterized protein KVR01_012795 [Diaporthe batatas]KAG8157411.1 hypothetical protein KVR01_012795 [Diaporthe batatas]